MSTKNPLSGMTEAQIRELVESAEIADGDAGTSPVEIVIRGANADVLLEKLGLTRNKSYDPDEEKGDEQTGDEESKPASKPGKGFADKLFGLNNAD